MLRNSLQILLLSLVFLAIAGCSDTKTGKKYRSIEDILSEFHQHETNHILIAAHRSMHINYPENSLAAIKDAIQNGVDIVEADVRTTSDGVMVLMHDVTIDRTTDGTGKVSGYSFQELQQYKLKTKPGDNHTHRIPSLEQALTLARNKIMVDLDIKDTHVRPLVDMVHLTGTEKQVIFFDADFGVLDSVLLLDTTLLIMPRAHSVAEVEKIFEHYSPPAVHIDKSFFTRDVVTKIRNHGARVWINALGIPDILAKTGIVSGYRSLTSGGAGIIQTDKPLIMDRYLKKNGFR